MDEKLHVLTPFLNQSWIFCIDNKLFTSALFEYYLDPFSASPMISLNSDPEANKEQRNSSKAGAWTLEYIPAHGQQIAIAINGGNSGFIRISEANFAFTNRIPNGILPSGARTLLLVRTYFTLLSVIDLVGLGWS